MNRYGIFTSKLLKLTLITLAVASIGVTSVFVAIPIITAAVCIASIVALFLIMRKTYPDLSEICTFADALSKGKLNANTPVFFDKQTESLVRSLVCIQENAIAVANEVGRVGKEISVNNLYARGDMDSVDSQGKIVIASLNNIINNLLSYVHDLPLVSCTFDKHARFTYINKLGQDQGFLPENITGKTLYELDPTDNTKEVTKRIEHTAKTGEAQSFQISIISPAGNEIIEDYYLGPLRNADGEITGAIVVNCDAAETAINKKVTAYQNEEASALTKILQEELDNGLLKFTYKPRPHDQDTSATAASYKKIGDTLSHSVAFIKDYVDEINQVLSAIADGDLTVSINREYIGDFASIKDSINNISCRLNNTLKEITSTSDKVLLGANQISATAAELANGAQIQAGSIEEVTASFDILSQQIQNDSNNAGEASALSDKSVKYAQESNNDMNRMLEAMQHIKDSGNNISKINSTIQEIAFKTNLLALNASVEAARAGDHGKGFSVVAEEVRNLAARSQSAATQTTELIDESIKRVDAGSSIAKNTADSLSNIVSSSNEILLVMDQIYASVKEQIESFDQVNANLSQISLVAQNNSAASEEAAAAAEELNSQAESLQRLVKYFRLK